MARYPADHKSDTRRRMIAAAGRRFKTDGFDGSGIAALVGDAGLTNGAFYGHFSSKDDLIASVVAEQLESQQEAIAALPEGDDAVADYVRGYLSRWHRDHPAQGCPSAALLAEIGRSGDRVRDAYTDGAAAIIGQLAERLGPGGGSDATNRAIAIFTVMLSAIQLARAVTDAELSDRVLAAARVTALDIARAAPSQANPARGQAECP